MAFGTLISDISFSISENKRVRLREQAVDGYFSAVFPPHPYGPICGISLKMRRIEVAEPFGSVTGGHYSPSGIAVL
jgi:hypothetical protein